MKVKFKRDWITKNRVYYANDGIQEISNEFKSKLPKSAEIISENKPAKNKVEDSENKELKRGRPKANENVQVESVSQGSDDSKTVSDNSDTVL